MLRSLIVRFSALLFFIIAWLLFWYWSSRIWWRYDDIGSAFWYEGRYALPAATLLFLLLLNWPFLRTRMRIPGRVLLATMVCLVLSPLWLLLLVLFLDLFNFV